MVQLLNCWISMSSSIDSYSHKSSASLGNRPLLKCWHCSAAGILSFFWELLYSHALFFTCDRKSTEIRNSLDIETSLLIEFHDNLSEVKDSQLGHFPIFSWWLKNIQRKMNEWRPQRCRELWVRPYQDSLAFYAFWFAVFIGAMSIVWLGATLAQTYAAFKGLELQRKQGWDCECN